MDKNYSSSFFFLYLSNIYIISRVSTVLLTGHYLIFIVIFLDSQPSNLEVETTFRPLVPVIFLFRSFSSVLRQLDEPSFFVPYSLVNPSLQMRYGWRGRA